MKNSCFLSLMLVAVAACLQCCGKLPENATTINGRCASVDGTMLYMTPVDDILNPVDSALVKDGQFCFTIVDSVPSVRFISTRQIIDGIYVYVEPGLVTVDFMGEEQIKGTPGNVCLNRFMQEREKIINLRRMAAPESVKELGLEPAICDSLKELEAIANKVYEGYAMKVIRENIDNPLGYFFLMKSVGVISPEFVAPMFRRVPLEFRDRLYETMKARAESELDIKSYAESVKKNLEATSVGKKFQNFELDNINGGKLLFSKEVFANKYTLLLFWAGWHDDAEKDIAAVSDMYKKTRKRGLQVVGVSLDKDVADCKAFVQKSGADWVQLCNPGGGSAELAAAYGVTELPEAVLVNRNGTIIARFKNVDDIRKKLKELFGK